MKAYKMMLNSDDSELLLAFEQGKTVEKTAKIMAKNASGVSRQLLRISEICSAVEKRSGKWVLTDMGKQLCASTKDFIQTQRHLASKQGILRFGTNREFGSRVIGGALEDLRKLFPSTFLLVNTYEAGTEEALLSGAIDIGFDCERPFDPAIAFRHLFKQNIIPVCSPLFKERFKKEIENKAWRELPHLLCDRLYPHRLTKNVNEVTAIARFNDIATTRAACVSGQGWALLPEYSVLVELHSKTLLQMDLPWGQSPYGIWWLRDRFKNSDLIDRLCAWTKKQRLTHAKD